MPRRRVVRRTFRIGISIALGLALGVGAYLGWQVLSAPGPRAAAGWTRLADLPQPRGETAVAVVGSRLYVIGGLTGLDFAATDAVSVFDSGTEAWSDAPALPAPRHHAAAAAIGGAVYVSGGAGSLGDGTPRSDAWVLRPGATAWEALPPMPAGRFGHRMVAIDARLYLVGGLGGPGDGAATTAPGAVLIFDTLAGTWAAGAPIPASRDHLAVVEVDGEIWAIGGRAGGGNEARADVYDPASDTWRAGPSLPEPTSGAAEAAIGGRILVSGGEDPGRGRIIDRHWVLDTRAGAGATWLALAPPPLTVHGAPGAVLGERFVIAGGASRPGGQSNTAWSPLTQVLLAVP